MAILRTATDIAVLRLLYKHHVRILGDHKVLLCIGAGSVGLFPRLKSTVIEVSEIRMIGIDMDLHRGLSDQDLASLSLQELFYGSGYRAQSAA
ncbi:MAG: hypothetical protein NT135_03085 [Candidatus Berkelbacteria bacterium]|nr:hypothetical protein [Candidatus Berkelbacteria bacterium]